MSTRARQSGVRQEGPFLQHAGTRFLCAWLAALQMLLPCIAAALPTDGQVVAGNATIQKVSPTSLSITQASEKAILNWNSFSIAANEAVRFVQPSVSSIALNRVVGADPSVILGHLQANGRIFLTNPNGILFGAGAQINVSGLLATTLQIRDDDFMSGRYLFAQDPLKGLKTVVNRGSINVSDNGYVILMAPGVSNEGVIVANLGTTVLGSGQRLTLDLMGDGLIRYAINDKVLGQVTGPDGKPLSSAVTNSGIIQADGGQVILAAKASDDVFSSVVNQRGVIRAHSLENHGGVVKLIGGDETLVAATDSGALRPSGTVSGAVINSGTLDVSPGDSSTTSGSIQMIGERVVHTGTIDAKGGNVAVASTNQTVIGSSSLIDVSGARTSSAGTVRIWSDYATTFGEHSTILARGGEAGGNGGFVEVSGKESLSFSGLVNALAPRGQVGTLLLDPRNITIATAGGVPYNAGVNNLFGNNIGLTTTITPASINSQLANVVLQANTDITVTNPIAMTNAGVGITMQAGRSINVNANVSTNNGNISLAANDATAMAADRLAGAGNITMAAGTTLNSGTGNINLTIGSSAAAPFNPGSITARTLTTNGGTVSIQSVGASTLAGNVSTNGGAVTLNNSGNLTVSGVISGALTSLTKTGAGTLTLSSANTYSGGTTINAGTLRLGAANRIANSSAVTVAGGATFNLNNFSETVGSLAGAGNVTLGSGTLTTGGNNTSTTFSGITSGTGRLTKAGSGIMTLSGANTYTGGTTINAGTLRLLGGTALADTSAVTLANVASATLDLNGTNETIGSLAGGGATGGNVTLGTGTLTTGVATNTTYSGILSGTGGLTKQGTGTFTLSGANTYTGGTTINAGSLRLGAANRIADTSAITVAGGATFNLNNFSETVGSLAGAGNVTLGSGTLTAGGNNSSTTYSGVMNGTGGLTKLGTGFMMLSGANTYSGATTINGGTLTLGAANRIANTSAVTVASGAIFNLNNFSETVGSLAGAGNVTLGVGTLTAGGNNSSTTFSGLLNGTGGLTKMGTGILTLSGVNTYTGATNVNAGTLRLGAANRIADTSALTVASGATFNLNNFSETVGSLAGAGNVTLGVGTLTAGGNNSSTTYSGVMSGTGGLAKAGTGTLTLSGANTYTGATTINGGTLSINADNRLGTAPAVPTAGHLTLNGGTLQTTGSFTLNANRGVALAGTGGIFNTNAGRTLTYNGIIAGLAISPLAKVGTGTLIVGGANTYTGATNVNAGTLRLGAANRIADTSALTVASGATFNLNNFSETVGSLAGAGNVTLGAGTLTAGGDNSSTSYSGIMSGMGGLTKLGTGTFTLSGNNTYSGATSVTGGTLVAASNNALGTAAGGTTVAAGATLGFSGGINYSTAESVTLNGGSLNNLGGNNTFAGPITLTANSAIIVANGTQLSLSGAVNGAGQLTVTGGTGGIQLQGMVGGVTPLTSLIASAASIDLNSVTTSGTQSYTGTTSLNGTYATTNSGFSVTGASTLGGATTVSTGSGAIMFNGSIDGAQNLTANSTGTTTFSGAVGNTTALTSLTTNAGGITAINGGNVSTTGAQTYNDSVTMNQATTLTSSGGTITFGGDVTNSAAGAGITVDAPTIALTGGTTIGSSGNGLINFFTDSLNPNGASINAGTGAFILAPNLLTKSIEFGDGNSARVTDVYYGSNFGSVTAGSVTIGRPTHTGNIFVTGVAAAPSALTFVNGGTGSVTFENAAYVSGNQYLGVVSGSGGVDLGTNLTLGSNVLRITSAGAITQSAGTVTAGTMGLSAGTGIDLSQPSNNVTTVAARTSAGNLSVSATNGFTLGSVGATADGFHPAVTGLNAGAGVVALQSGGAVTQTAAITASGLRLLGSGSYALTSGSNNVATVAANTTGTIQYTNANALAIGTVGGTTGVTSGNNNIALTANTGNLTLNEVVNAGTGSVALTALAGSILDGNGGANNLMASTANLNAANGIGTAGGALNTSVSVLNASTTAGDIFVSEADAVTLGAVSATAGNVTIDNSAGDMTITSVSALAGAVDLSASGGSILSGGGIGPHLTAGGNSTLQAFNGVVGTRVAPITVAVNPGTLSIRATTATGGISGFLTGTVLPSNTLTLLNVPPGLVCLNGCPVTASTGFGGLFGSGFSALAYFNRDAIVPTYYLDPSGATQLPQVASEYVPDSVLVASEARVIADQYSVALGPPPCVGCMYSGGLLAAPAKGTDPEAVKANSPVKSQAKEKR